MKSNSTENRANKTVTKLELFDKLRKKDQKSWVLFYYILAPTKEKKKVSMSKVLKVLSTIPPSALLPC